MVYLLLARATLFFRTQPYAEQVREFVTKPSCAQESPDYAQLTRSYQTPHSAATARQLCAMPLTTAPEHLLRALTRTFPVGPRAALAADRVTRLNSAPELLPHAPMTHFTQAEQYAAH